MKKNILELAKKLSYSPVLGGCVRRLGLREPMRKIYAKLYGSPSVLKFSLKGIEGTFETRTPLELRSVEGTWVSEHKMIADVMSELRTEDTFLDVGGNLGMFTVFAAKLVGPEGSVLAFEPESVAFTRLQENIQLNRLENVKVFKIALSAAAGKQTLLLGPADGVSQSSRVAAGEGPSELIDVVDYDSLIRLQRYPVPNVVKMDIEGHEYKALQGMRGSLSDSRCRAIFCEVHPEDLTDGATADDVVELIKSFGFQYISFSQREFQLHLTAKKSAARS